MFIFICWWFPRAWSKGQAKQNKEWDEINRQRREREEAEASTDVELGDTAGNPVNADASKTTAQPRTTTYVPPVTAYWWIQNLQFDWCYLRVRALLFSGVSHVTHLYFAIFSRDVIQSWSCQLRHHFWPEPLQPSYWASQIKSPTQLEFWDMSGVCSSQWNQFSHNYLYQVIWTMTLLL